MFKFHFIFRSINVFLYLNPTQYGYYHQRFLHICLIQSTIRSTPNVSSVSFAALMDHSYMDSYALGAHYMPLFQLINA